MRLCYNTFRCCVLLFFTVISLYKLHSQTLFVGSDGGDWFTASNWNNGLPAVGNDATIPSGKTVVISQALNVNFNIQSFGGIKNTSTLTLATNLVSGGSITNTGTLIVKSGVTLTSSGGITNSGTVTNNGTCNSNSAFTNVLGGIVNNNSTWTQQAALTNNGTFCANAGTFTCPQVFTNNSQVKVLAGATFKVDFGGSFTNATGSTLTNGGSFSNLGTFLNTTTVTNTGMFTNNSSHTCNGIFNNENGGTLTSTSTIDINGRINNKAGGTVINSFNFNVKGTGYFDNAGTFSNGNTITISLGGTFCNEATGAINTNFGSSIVDNGYLKNLAGGQIVGNGAITTTKKLDNFGLIDAQGGAQVTIGDTLNNAGTINVANILTNNGCIFSSGAFNINSGGTVNNTKKFTVLAGGKFTNGYEYYNKAGATTTNNGSFTNNVRVFNEGGFTNNAYFLTFGDVFNKATGVLTNTELIEVNGGSIVNQGSVANSKSIYLDQCSVLSNKLSINNTGAIYSSALIFQRGTVTGNAIIKNAGFIQTAATSDAAICRTTLSTGSDLNGEAKVYGQNPILPNIGIDSCAGFQYFVDGVNRKVYTCAQVGTTVTARAKIIVRTGDSLTCNIPITIFDGVAPTFTNCPSDVKILTKNTTEKYTWTAPTVTDNCDAAPSVVTNIASGSSFNLGATQIVITAKDKYNNSRDCRFTITLVSVPDAGACTSASAAPVFKNCPANISVSVPYGNAAAVWNEPSFSGSCLPIALTQTSVSGAIFPSGATTVTYTATDVNKKVGTCSFTVNVTSGDLCTSDNIAPVITNCPANIFVTTNTVLNGAVAIWTAPSATDNCGGVTLTSTATPGSVFPVGATVVTYTAKDTKNNSSTCAFTVNVGATNPCAGDVAAPVISGCPGTITQSTTGTTATVTWTEPTATDACAPVTVNKSNLPGSNFQVGTTKVTYCFSDKVGNLSKCSFNVTVNNPCFNDTLAPVLGTCPADITVSGASSATATWTNPTATDNCGAVTVTSSPASGSTFPIGISTVTVKAVDTRGNTSSCSFKVTVQNNSCASTTATGGLLREVWFNNSDPNVCPISPIPTSTPNTNIITSFQGPSYIADNYKTRVRGYIRPTETTDYIFTAVGDDNVDLYLSTDDNPSNKKEIASICGWTNEGELNKYPSQKSAAVTLVAGRNYYVELVHQEFGGGDHFSAYWQKKSTTTSKSELVINGDFSGGNTGFSSDFANATASNNGCNSYQIFPLQKYFSWAPPAIPTPDGKAGNMMYFDNNGDGVTHKVWYQTVTVAAGATYNFSAFATKIYAYNTPRLFLTVNGQKISQPFDMTNAAVGTWFNMVGTWTSTKTGTVEIAVINENGDCNGNDGALDYISFNTNTTAGTFTAPVIIPGTNLVPYDPTCIACLTDVTPPVLGTCPTDITVTAATGSTSATATWTNPTATDNCSTATVTSTPLSGSSFAIGVNTVTITAADAKGNKSTCTFKVNVNPAITCSVPTTPFGWMLLGQFNNSTYFKYTGGDQTYDNAKALAQSIGGRLPAIKSAAQNDFIKNAVNGNSWIGLERSGAGWVTSEGSAATYFNWSAGEPNNSGGNENSGQMYSSGTWNDLNASGYNWAVAEVPCGSVVPPCTVKGTYYYERWLNVNYNWIQPIVLPTTPVNDVIIQNPLDLQMPVPNRDVNYLSRARGYITAPETGDYYFNLTGDDFTEFWLSASTDVTKVQKMCYIYDWSYPTEYGKYPSQTSVKVTLTAGQLYYFDLKHYQGWGGDDFHVYWKKPSNPNNWCQITSANISYPCDIQKTASISQKAFGFELSADNKNAHISWITNQGETADYYTVERLNASGNFEGIYKTSGLNGSNKMATYSYLDTKTTDGDNFYRIKTTYVDGNESYSEVKKVTFALSGGLNVFPNPTDDFLDIDLSNYEGKAVGISIYNVLGQSVYRFNLESAPKSAFRINTESFNLGTHLVKVDVKGLPTITKHVLIAR